MHWIVNVELPNGVHDISAARHPLISGLFEG
jgi:hypothetical protein